MTVELSVLQANALLLSLLVAVLLPLALVVPVYYRGRARARAGKVPGWDGEGWRLRHVWLAFSLLIAAELLVFYALEPEAFARLIARVPRSRIDLGPADEMGGEVLWATLAVGASLLVIIPLAPLRMLWTSRWSVSKALGVALIAFIALRLLTVLLVPFLPEITSEDHPQRELTESLTQLAREHSPWLTLLIAALLAPLIEEVLFRGVLLTGLARHLSFGWANAIQAVLFGVLHLTAPLFPFFVVLGLIGGELMRRSGGLLAPIAVHVLNNGTAVVGLWLLTEHSGM
jgi:uncharacterized protein